MLLETRLDPKRTGEKVCVDTSQTLCGHMWPLSKFNKATVENTTAPRRYGLLRRHCPSAAGHCCQEGLRCAPGLREPGWASGVCRCLSGVWLHNSRKCLIRTKPRPPELLTCKTDMAELYIKDCVALIHSGLRNKQFVAHNKTQHGRRAQAGQEIDTTLIYRK